MSRPVILSAALALAALLFPPHRLRADPTIWFEDARHSPALSDGSVRAVTAYIRHRLLAGKDAKPVDAPLMPAAVRDDFFPRIVFISACDGIRPARVAIGAARGILKAADDAIAQLEPTEKDPYRLRWLKVDVPHTILAQDPIDLTRPLEFERSLFGLAFPRGQRIALVPEQLIAGNVINHEQGFFPEQLAVYLKSLSPPPATRELQIKLEAAAVFRFSVQSFFADADTIEPLYRGHRQFTRVTQVQLKASITAAAAYLAQAVNRSGQFAYLYHPDTDRVADEYSVLHHLTAVLAMLDSHEVTNDAQVLAGAKRALDFLDASIGQWTQQGERVPAIVERGQVRLGTQALMAASLARLAAITGDKKTADRAKAFAATVRLAQLEDGSFVHFQTFPDGNAHVLTSPDFDGQAILALALADRVAPDRRWLEAAEMATKHVVLSRDKGVPVGKLPHDDWLLCGLAELQSRRPSPVVAEHVSRLSQAIAQAQHRVPAYNDWLGGYYSPPGTMAAAQRTAGLLAAYRTLRASNNAAERADAIAALEASILGIAFQLQCQFRPESAMYFHDPQRISGAFRESLTSPAVRIDYTAHNLLALNSLLRLMEEEKVTSYAAAKAERESGSDKTTPP